MKKTSVCTVFISLLGLLLSLFFLFIIPDGIGIVIIATGSATVIVYLLQIVLLLILFGKQKENDALYITPVVTVSIVYMVIQFIICVITAFLENSLSLKSVLLVNIPFFIIFWMIVIALSVSRSHIQRIDGRQKMHHTDI